MEKKLLKNKWGFTLSADNDGKISHFFRKEDKNGW
jgi:hypothetical protein